MIKKLIQVLSIAALLQGLAFSAQAGSINSVTCDNCTDSEAYAAAYSWALPRLNHGPSGVSFDVHVADFKQKKTRSFRAFAYQSSPGPLPSYRVVVDDISTPSNIKLDFNLLYNELDDMLHFARSIVIPENVIEDAWEYVGCAYCNTRVENYINTMSEWEQGYRTVEQLANSVGLVSSALPNTYTVALKSGGDLTFKITLDGDFKLRIKIIEVRDEAGNEVPDKPDSLTDIRIAVETPEQRIEINDWLRDFGFRLGSSPNVGVITIEEL